MVSLLHLAVITEEGVAFQSPHDGRDMLLTPEHSIAIQNRLGTLWHDLIKVIGYLKFGLDCMSAGCLVIGI